jgi:hypothetical protein
MTPLRKLNNLTAEHAESAENFIEPRRRKEREEKT